MNCAQNYFYQKITGLEILSGQSQKVNLYRAYEEDVKNNQLWFQILAPDSKSESLINNNTLCKTFTIAAINDYIKQKNKVYPNPFSEYLIIENPDSENMQIELLDSNGRVIIKSKTEEQNINLETSKLKPGICILKISSKKMTFTQTIIKQ